MQSLFDLKEKAKVPSSRGAALFVIFVLFLFCFAEKRNTTMTCAHVPPSKSLYIHQRQQNHFTFILVREIGVLQHSAWSLVYSTIACVLEEVTNQIHSKQEMKATMFVLH